MHPALGQANLQRLPLIVRRYAKAACNEDGTLEDLKRVVKFLQDANRIEIRYALPVLYAVLDPARIPDETDLDLGSLHHTVTSKCQRVLEVLQAIGQTPVLKHSPEVAPEVWARIWPWIQFLHLYREALLPRSNPFRSEANLTLLFLQVIGILAVKPDSEVSIMILDTPGVVFILARAWPHIHDFQTPKWRVFACSILIRFFTKSLERPTQRAEFIEGAGGSLHDVARLAILHMDEIMLESDFTTDDDIANAFALLLDFVRDVDPTQFGADSRPLSTGFAAALLSQGLVRVLSESALALSGSPLPAAHSGLTQVLVTLGIIIMTAPGHLRLAEGIKHHLIHGIIRIATGPFAYDLCSMLNGFLVDFIPPFPVRLEVVAAFKAIEPELEALTATAAFRQSRISDDWKKFKTLLDQRLEIYEWYISDDYVPMKMCANLQCSQLQKKYDFRRCSGCLAFYYCSPKCQAVDWREGGHRNSCASHRLAYLEHQKKDLTAGDKSFLRAIMDSYLAHARFDLLKGQLDFIRKAPGRDFVTVHRYMNLEPSFEFHSLVHPHKVRSAWENVILRARASGGRIGLDIVEFGLGKEHDFWDVPLQTQRPTLELLRRIAGEVPAGSQEEEKRLRTICSRMEKEGQAFEAH